MIFKTTQKEGQIYVRNPEINSVLEHFHHHSTFVGKLSQ